jgi:hypothetical protein
MTDVEPPDDMTEGAEDVHDVLESLRPVSEMCRNLLPDLPEIIEVPETDASRFLNFLKPLNEMADRLRSQDEATTT